MTLDSTTWGALALVLTAIGAVLTVVAWRRRGPASGVRALAWTLLPVAAWLTGTLRLAAAIVGDVADWAARLVFSPVVWAGVVVAGVSGLLFAVSGVLRSRGLGVRRRGVKVTQQPVEGRETPAVAAAPTPRGRAARQAPPQDDDMAEIEAILKKHGI